MQTINLTIPNMKGPHCQITVTNAVKNIGASVKNISLAKAEIDLQNDVTKEEVIGAIEKAGYKVKA